MTNLILFYSNFHLKSSKIGKSSQFSRDFHLKFDRSLNPNFGNQLKSFQGFLLNYERKKIQIGEQENRANHDLFLN